jgi:Fe(3+) dicitrate transport protein
MLLLAPHVALQAQVSAQARADSARRAAADSVAQRMGTVRVVATPVPGSVRAAPRLAAGIVTTGAKSEVVQVDGMSANLSEKTARQIFAEVPGIFVYDMDGAGNQINVSARGLDPHRSWEFNVRQNGVQTTSDEYAYPASHYSAPMEAVQRVELIRGTAALQYGSQFGGLLNYVIKSPDTTRAATFESRSTAGTLGLASSWNAVGGRVGRVSYYGYADVRRSDGFRSNEGSVSDAEYLSASMPLSPTLLLRAEVGRSWYRYHQPGPLNDAMFAANPRASTRSRNWYSPDITVPSLTFTWAASPRTTATLVASGVFGTRTVLAVGGFATTPDTANSAGVFSTRQLDLDRYVTRTAELRVRHDTRLGTWPVTVSGGLAYTNNNTRRRQQGTGSRGSDFTRVLEPGGDFKRDLYYRTLNVAGYAEAEVHVSPRWTLIPGARVEQGATHMTGRLAYYDPANTPRDIQHKFPLFGLRSSYALPTGAEWYAGFSQAYRPMILKDVLPETATERTDKSLRDASGWTVETGVRGTLSHGIDYDIGGFVMRYANRFGLLTATDSTGTPYTYKTNLGTTRTLGVESRLSAMLGVTHGIAWRAFSALSLMDARYAKGTAISVGRNVDISGNELESAPKVIARGGLSARTRRGDLTVQVSHVARTFADALNTALPSANGAVGIVPAYTLVDFSGGVTVMSRLSISTSINNLLDRQYFTKRPQLYPGAGVWPSSGRTMQLTVHLRSGPTTY